MQQKDVKRFWSKVDIRGPDDCWLWPKVKLSFYGTFYHDGTQSLSHRVAYELTNGAIPEGMKVLHKCDVTHCCNPKHLFLGTQADNVRDMINKGRGKQPSKFLKGSSHDNAKLTEENVLEIRKRYADGEPAKIIAIDYGIKKDHVTRIVRRDRWGHI